MIKIVDFVKNNQKLIFITFQIFWIIVFLLDRVTNTNATDIPEFIYVNF